jgi:hypothetical protein
MPRVGFEFTFLVFESANTLLALQRTLIVIGLILDILMGPSVAHHPRTGCSMNNEAASVMMEAVLTCDTFTKY